MKKLIHHLLVSSPNMSDNRFAQSVIYIAQHDEQGTLGFIINQPLNANMLNIFQDVDLEYSHIHRGAHTQHAVLDGGPMMPEVGFVLHTGLPKWQSSTSVTENICFTTSKDILETIAKDNSLPHYYMCLGHASWEPQQLEDELAAGDWFLAKADTDFLFELPLDKRWHQAGLKAGVDFNWLCESVGNA